MKYRSKDLGQMVILSKLGANPPRNECARSNVQNIFLKLDSSYLEAIDYILKLFDEYYMYIAI